MSLPAVKYGTLEQRYLEMDSINALSCSKGNFDAHMATSEKGVSECNGGYATYMGALIPFAIPKLM